jgi:GntR family transcriptional regulator/MocR family aminotransferase
MLIIPIDTGALVPLYEQIYNYIKKEIRTGKLTVASKLPSTRSLSSSLLISRSTVELAYSQLISEGYIEAVPKSGYYVLSTGDLIELPQEKVKMSHAIIKSKESFTYDFSPFSVDISEFPFATW